ncbi:MAG: branched-chain amino acid ABC transporter permease [Deltaproteobacteria bacterium]|nr:branched-chain amino acid ABC transporter permease [Deltaproteobacteria bacterium]
MTQFVQQLVNGLSLGAIYALVALGYTMVYGTLQFINFAHSEVFMAGAFAAMVVAVHAGVAENPTWAGVALVAVAAMLFSMVLAIVVERVAYRPMRKSSRLNVLITAIGVSIFLQNVALVSFGTVLPFPEIVPRTAWELGGVRVSLNNVLILGVTLALMVALTYVVERTKIGLAMRAVSHSRDTAALMGIPVDRVIVATFAVGSLLAGAAAFLFCIENPRVDPAMGANIGLKAFVAAVVGGIGSIPGAVVGAIVLGLAETMVSGYFTSTWRDAIAFLLLIVVLLYKPSGLFGRHQMEKV